MFLVILLVCCVPAITPSFATRTKTLHSLSPRAEVFNWTSLTPSTNLSWTPCYDTFQCARLTLPLQYSNMSAGEVQIALTMSPSNFTAGDPNYRGPILFNPGGPGGSGVQYVLEFAPYFRAIVGPQYDLVGFDPRGVGFSTPLMSILKSPIEASSLFATYPVDLNDSDSSLGRAYAQATVLDMLTNDRSALMAQSVSTAAVATDMLRIAQEFGQDMVNYWGISYGSVLGAAFAAMYPQNVGRFVIDGVVSAIDWFQGSIVNSVLDTDNALTAYYAACVEAGPSLCAIYEDSVDKIRARVDKLIAQIRIAPVPMYVDTNLSAISFGVVDSSTVLQQLFSTLYEPFSSGPRFAGALAALERGDGSLIFPGSDASAFEALDTCNFDPSQPFVSPFIDLIAPIKCGDSLVNGTQTLAQSSAAYADMLSVSPFASVWFGLTQGPCAPWSLRGKDQFNGSFVQNTSTPILLVGNTNDPVAPIESARNISSGFAGSVVLQQNSTGHTSLSGFSTCTALAISQYFINGTLPAAGTICQTDTKIFEAPNNSSAFGGITFNGRRRGTPELEGSSDVPFEDAVKALAQGNVVARYGWAPQARLGMIL